VLTKVTSYSRMSCDPMPLAYRLLKLLASSFFQIRNCSHSLHSFVPFHPKIVRNGTPWPVLPS
jgi:hypothetical protein